MTFKRGDIALVEAPLAPFFESRKEIATCEFVDRIGAKVEEECDLTRIKQDVVLIGHDSPPTDPGNARFCNTRDPIKSSPVGLLEY